MSQTTRMLASFFKNKQGRMVIAQWPNTPLWIVIGAWGLRHIVRGTPYAIVDVAFVTALLVWSWLEITSGDSPFRRVLGAAVMLWLLASRLQ